MNGTNNFIDLKWGIAFCGRIISSYRKLNQLVGGGKVLGWSLMNEIWCNFYIRLNFSMTTKLIKRGGSVYRLKLSILEARNLLIIFIIRKAHN